MGHFSPLSNLKAIIAKENAIDPLEEWVVESSNDSIRDQILDDFQFSLLGAESDSSLDALARTIPEYEDEDPEMEKKLEVLKESVEETEID